MEEQKIELNNKATFAQKITEDRITQIYDDLRSLGYHEFLKPEFNVQKKPGQLLSIYFHATPSRQNLIQWLISLGFPQYKEEPQYSVPLSRTLSKTKKLASSIWKMGLMPFSKHTKTMDYGRYIEGMLGFENSVKLIYELTKFARKSKHLQLKKNQMQENQRIFGACLNQLFLNFQTLVNQDYDPYGITFPSAYNDIDQTEVNKKIIEIRQEIQYRCQKNVDCIDGQKQNEGLNKLLQNAQGHRQKFDQKYKQLLNTIKSLQSDPNNQIFFKKGVKKIQNSFNTQKSVAIQKRRLNIPLSLCQKVKQLKKVKKLREINPLSNLKRLRQELQAIMIQANQNIVF